MLAVHHGCFNSAYIVRAMTSNLQCRWNGSLHRDRYLTLNRFLLFLDTEEYGPQIS